MPSVKSVLASVALVAIALVSFGATSHAAGAVHATDGSLWDVLRPVYEAFVGHQYWYAGSLAVVLGVALTKRYLADSVPFLHTDAGGAVMALVGSFGGACAAALGGSVTMTWDIAGNALKIAVAAAGGYAVIKALLIVPVLEPLIAKSPPWMQSILRGIAWVFDGSRAANAAPITPEVPTVPDMPVVLVPVAAVPAAPAAPVPTAPSPASPSAAPSSAPDAVVVTVPVVPVAAPAIPAVSADPVLVAPVAPVTDAPKAPEIK